LRPFPQPARISELLEALVEEDAAHGLSSLDATLIILTRDVDAARSRVEQG
jgi:hypothetical protein